MKFIKKIVQEAIINIHYKERLFNRILDRTDLPIGYEIPGSMGQYVVVGTYIIPQELKNQVLQNVRLIENYKFPKIKTYGIKIAELRIDPNAVIFISEDLKKESLNKTLVIVDEETNSNGNIIYAIIRDNSLITFYFAKSYVKQSPEKLRVDVVSTMDAIRNNKIY